MANEKNPPPFLEFLERNRENPGVMADLRCALIPSLEYRSWQYIARFCKLEDDRERTIAATVCAAFGIGPESAGERENMGDVMGRIAHGDNGENGLSSFMLYFQRLLACNTIQELAPQLHGIFLAARSRNVLVNHKNLWYDLFSWSDRVKCRWASHYWSYARKAENAGGGSNE